MSFRFSHPAWAYSFSFGHPGSLSFIYNSGSDFGFSRMWADLVEASQRLEIVIETPFSTSVFLGRGSDLFVSDSFVDFLSAGRGADSVTLHDGGGRVLMGRGHDTLILDELVDVARGGRGDDTLVFSFNAGETDIAVQGRTFTFFDRFTGKKMDARSFETIVFEDRTFSKDDLDALFGSGAAVPSFQVGGGTQILTVNDVDPTVSVIWDRVIQQAVVDNDGPNGPTIASRAYAMMHTAMYDAWSAFDAVATYVSFDAEGDNIKTTGTEDDKIKAMSFAAITVLRNLFPEQEDLYAEVMQERYGFALSDDGSIAAQIGIDAAQDILALRAEDGANQTGSYADTTGYTPVNSSPLDIADIARWTPENVPIDPEDDEAEQTFLTAHWLEVEGFALAENADGSTDFSATLPPPPKGFFTDAFAGSSLDMEAKTITLSTDFDHEGVSYEAGDSIEVSQALIGTVINAAFIEQAEEVIAISAALTDEQKIIAEFWEDGGGTAFPPGTFMAFAQFASARDNNTVDQDAQLFLMMSNAVMDAGIATWQSKVEYDYARPVRVIRDLGELELIGTLGVDENTGETGYVIEAFGGFTEDGSGRGTQTILAENFITFQRPGADPSPPFSEYTSGHSAFSSAGAEVLHLFTGSDAFGGSVTFEPDTIQFENGVPDTEVTLAWDTFSQAADEAGFSRLYGGIHFNDGDVNGRTLGREVGASAYEAALSFIDGTATDEDRPFYDDFLFA